MAQPRRTVSPNDASYTIGDLAEEFGLTLRCIRFYEDEGLLSPTRAGQQRLYSHSDHAHLRLICRGKRLGFSIAEIKEFLALYQHDPCQGGQMQYLLDKARERREALVMQMEDARQTIGELQQIEQQILDHLNHCTKDS